ncbi:OprO/OprP family phosphate-selective porin [Chitinophaga nivalis]|uniref:OprO/OprP family phosphate-selective porin n=1 Tax=Chitinophaga nivalis TaxID=2991709 RepID=A0ABT3IN54_9BACT|nr:OprO/OprP family phosphate-selective porin [Chitinophaga nivalis]MCW3464924.1 OprO/OprP family phosphate-selective porin [Chitinophaga nivalis]MCW3485384.1 OprO/OprP family phosphate-selective porin [Chitinophaga nivalis]
MKMKLVLTVSFVCLSGYLFAQTAPVPASDTTKEVSAPLIKKRPEALQNVHMNFLLRSSLEIPDGDKQSAMRLNEARIEVLGTILPDLDFRIRYRLNRSQVQRDLDNAPASLDIASVNYKFGNGKKWSVNVGKQAAYVGNWEFETNPTYEYQYSEFVNFQTNLFLMGVRLGYQVNKNHGFFLQLHNTYNNAFNTTYTNAGYAADGLKGSKTPMGVYASWLGKMFDQKLHTFWSYDIAQYASGKTNHAVALGNKVVLNKLKGYLDLQWAAMAVDYVNIASPSVNKYQQRLHPDFTPAFARDINYKGAVLRLDYEFVPGWFITTKGIFESASQTKNSAAPGKNFRQNIGLLAGLEYKPIASQNMKLFGYYYNNQVKYRNVIADANAHQRSSLFAVGVLYLVNAF